MNRLVALTMLFLCQVVFAGDGAISSGLHIHRLETAGWPPLAFRHLRLWDAGVRWSQVEIQRGKFDWGHLDRRVAVAGANGVDVLYTLGGTPRWAASLPDQKGSYGAGSASPPLLMDDWRRFVESVASRFRGRIGAYEIWNEPNEAGFFSGTVQQMVELVKTASEVIHSVDPHAKVVCPAAVSERGIVWLRRFSAAGGLGHCDVAAFHFYVTPRPPEAMVGLIKQVRAVLADHGYSTMPLWNTEFGWYVDTPEGDRDEGAAPEGFKTRLRESEVAAYLVRSYLLQAANGVERAYYYSWDHDEIGLASRNTDRIRASGLAFGEVNKWLAGKTVKDCSSNNGAMRCRLCNSENCAPVVWSVSKNPAYPKVTRPGAVGAIRDLTTGNTSQAQVRGDGSIEVSIAPVMFDTTVVQVPREGK